MSEIQIQLRQATDADCGYILRLRNDDESVRNSLTGRAIPKDEHVAWYNDSRARGTSFHFIAEHHTKFRPHKDELADTVVQSVGCARLDCDHGRLRVSIAVDPEYRRRGLGTDIVRCLVDYSRERWPDTPLYAEIKRENVASQIVFRKAGFKPTQEVETVEIR